MQHFFHARLNMNELLFSSRCHLFFELQFHRIEQMKENEMIYIATFNVLAGLCPPPHQSAHQPQLFDVVGFPCSCKVSNSVFPIISKSFKRLFEMTDIILLPLHSLLVCIIYLTVVIIAVSLLAWPQIPLIASSTPTRSTSSFIEVAHSFLRYVLYQNEIAFKNLCLFCCCVVICLIQNFVLRTTFLSFQYRIE